MLRKLEKYEVLDEIGHGGMATVYRARDSSLDRFVALKVLHPHLQRTTEARARFAREAKSVARLRHPHILEIYDYSGETSDETYIAAELLTGPTLKDFVLSQGELPPEIAACVALQLAEALGEAHAKGVIHRDVKPENVLVHEDRCVKLTDFGIAHMVDTHTFTATGQILGSPGHMAPEQVEGGTCDVRSDVFSLGTVLYFCATGRLPFVGRNPHHLLKLLLGGEYPDPLRLQPAIGAELASIMRKALSHDPAERYQSANDMAEALRGFLDEMEIEDPDETLERYLRNPGVAAAALRERSVDRLIEIGEAAARTGDVPKTQAAMSRVLAIDDGNERALEVLGSLGRRRRYGAILGGLVVLVLLLTIGGVAYWRWSPHQAEQPGVPRGETLRSSAVEAGSDVARAGSEDEPSPQDRAFGGEAPDRAPAPPETDPEVSTNEPTDPDAQTVDEPKERSSNGRRWVTFNPTPPNVSIAVDGGPLRPYGPDYRRVRLKTGTHTFRFVGAQDCCRDRVVRKRIPPGARDYELAVRLRYAPARLYLKGPAPPGAQVQIRLAGNRTMQGRIREILRIPMRSLDATAQVEVRAPGYRTHKSVVTLRAGGEVTEHPFTLERKQQTP
jgi:serine/threonine-protein kinase